MLIDREAVIQQLTDGGVLEHDGCGVFIASGDASELITAVMQIAQRAAEQEREACKAAIESCVNELGFGGGTPGRWMADRCLRAISERTKAPT